MIALNRLRTHLIVMATLAWLPSIAAAAGQSAFFVQHASSAGETCFDVDTRSLPFSCHRISDGAETVVAAREFRRTWVG